MKFLFPIITYCILLSSCTEEPKALPPKENTSPAPQTMPVSTEQSSVKTPEMNFPSENIEYDIIDIPSGGFGYIIMAQGKTLISQENIPSIQGVQPFQTIEDARNVAELVVQKIQSNQSPSISIEDLDNLNIARK